MRFFHYIALALAAAVATQAVELELETFAEKVGDDLAADKALWNKI